MHCVSACPIDESRRREMQSDRRPLTRPPFVRVAERCSACVCVCRQYIFKVGARVLCCCDSIMSLKGASMKKIDKSIIGNTAVH